MEVSISEQIHEQVLSLPIGPVLTLVDVEEVITVCNNFN